MDCEFSENSSHINEKWYVIKQETPRREEEFLSGRGVERGIVEADAGYVGGFDGVGVVIALFREDDGEVLDAVFDAESLK